MKLFKNVLVSVLIGHALGIVASLLCAFFALKMPDINLSSAIFGILSCTVGTLVMAIASKKQSSGSVVCALLCGAFYTALSMALGMLLFEKDSFGRMEAVMVAESFVFPLLFCFSGIAFMGKRRKKRRISQKIYK